MSTLVNGTVAGDRWIERSGFVNRAWVLVRVKRSADRCLFEERSVSMCDDVWISGYVIVLAFYVAKAYRSVLVSALRSVVLSAEICFERSVVVLVSSAFSVFLLRERERSGLCYRWKDQMSPKRCRFDFSVSVLH
ncbi:hypothetical protein F511_39626 [Dorcoceras hygrometricum]|uniref:Uncharacterized protein n=1 Tax=Dorcoceras hygrometricum TaxID=472368 RepID=A0A2Z7B476_9LAMI|nr:hypothetical protein F511_39626 [Dorcoceras hygrometricum]